MHYATVFVGSGTHVENGGVANGFGISHLAQSSHVPALEINLLVLLAQSVVQHVKTSETFLHLFWLSRSGSWHLAHYSHLPVTRFLNSFFATLHVLGATQPVGAVAGGTIAFGTLGATQEAHKPLNV